MSSLAEESFSTPPERPALRVRAFSNGISAAWAPRVICGRFASMVTCLLACVRRRRSHDAPDPFCEDGSWDWASRPFGSLLKRVLLCSMRMPGRMRVLQTAAVFKPAEAFDHEAPMRRRIAF